jgi:hypothetical protein
MSLNEEQQVQLRNTALEKGVRMVMSGFLPAHEMYDVTRNFYDYMAHGVTPDTWNEYQPSIGD